MIERERGKDGQRKEKEWGTQAAFDWTDSVSETVRDGVRDDVSLSLSHTKLKVREQKKEIK